MGEAESPTAAGRHRQRNWAYTIAVAVLAAAGIILLTSFISGWQVVRLPFPGLFTEPTLVVNELGDETWPGYAAGFLHPQWLLTLDDQPLEHTGALVEALSNYQVGDVVTLTAEDSTGDRHQAEVQLIRFPAESLLNEFLLPNLLGWAFLAIGIWVARAAPREEKTTVFIAACTALAMAVGLLFDLSTTHRVWWAWVPALPIAGSICLHLALVFPNRLGLLRSAPWLRWLIYVPGIAVAIISVVSTMRWDVRTAYIDPWFWGMVWAGFGAAVLTVFTVGRRYLSPSPVIRAQVRTVMWGTLLGVGPFVLWVFATRSLGVQFVALFVLPPLILLPLSIAHVLLRHRTLDIDWIVRRVATYMLLTGLAVGLYFVLFLALERVLRPVAPMTNPFLLIGFSVLAALGAQPARVLIQRGVDWVVLGRRVTPERALRDFTSEVTASRTEEKVVASLTEVLERGLTPRYALLYRLDERTGWYIPRVLTGDAPHLVRFRSDGPLARRMVSEHQPTYLSVRSGLPEGLEDETVRLRDLGPALFIPLLEQGWLTVGPTRARRFRAADMRFAEVLAPQVQAALERVRLISDLERRVLEM